MIGPVAVCEAFEPVMEERVRSAAGPDLDLAFPRDAADLSRGARGARYLVVRAVPLPEAVLDAAPSVRLIHQWGTGTDGIPAARAAARGVAVARCPGVNAPSVADLTIGLVLAAIRRIPRLDAAIRAGGWPIDAFSDRAFDLCEAHVGLVGYGAIARTVARRLSGFGSEVRYARLSGPLPGEEAGFRPLDGLLAWSAPGHRTGRVVRRATRFRAHWAHSAARDVARAGALRGRKPSGPMPEALGQR